MMTSDQLKAFKRYPGAQVHSAPEYGDTPFGRVLVSPLAD